MKREITILNVVCVLLALAFVAFAVWNLWSSLPALSTFSEFIASLYRFATIDNLFITAFCLLMALVFISIPASWAVETGKVKIPFVGGLLGPGSAENAGAGALPAGGAAAAIGPVNRGAAGGGALPAPAPVQRDAKGRPIPPDVQKMLAEMNRPGEKSEQQPS